VIVLVTGSAGFVGKHTVRAFEDRGDEVIQADKVTGQDLTLPIEPWHPTPDVIVHLAATCSTSGSIRDPMTTFRDTVLSAVNVLEAARIPRIPVIVTSSVKARDGQTPYGAAKRMVELWATEYRTAYNLPVVINRPGTIYGPGQEGSPESGWISWFLKAKAEGFPIVVNGDGQQMRDLLHVSDYVRLLVKQATDPDRYNTGTIYDVGGGARNAVTVNEIVEYLGLTHTYGPERYGDAREYIGLNNVADWSPAVKWQDAL
jgi:Nucleoside-diphosphate-sugar epimerases